MFIIFFLLSQVAEVKVVKVATDTSIYPSLYIYTSVLNQEGLPAINLTSEDFIIYEDGKEAGNPDSVKPFPADRPTYSLILVDASKNMQERDTTLVQMALWKLLTERTETNRFIVSFFADTLVPLFNEGEKFDEREGFVRINNIRRILKKREARIRDMVAFGIKLLKERTDNLSLSAIILFSKGIDDNSRIQMDTLKALSVISQIPVFSVGINATGNILSQIAEVTGGDYMSGNTLKDLEYAYRRISFKVRQSNILVHNTKIPADGSFHRIEVSVNNINGVRNFRMPYKPRKPNLLFILVLVAGTVVLVEIYILIRRKKRRKVLAEVSELPEEISEPPEEEIEKSQEKEEIKPHVEEKEIVKEKRESTRIISSHLPMEIKRYGVKQKIIYKGKELETDIRLEIDLNKLVRIGSSDKNDLVLPELSPEHITILWQYNQLEINAIDETMVNGDVIKGRKVYEEKGKYVINPGPYVLVLKLE